MYRILCQVQAWTEGCGQSDEFLESSMPAQIRVLRPAMTQFIEPVPATRHF